MDPVKSLQTYHAKRNFSITPEPENGGKSMAVRQFVIQKHWASSLHYDFRLELNGVMKSWAIPKGPSYDPGIKRMAVHVEDHPIAYSSFEGTIPAKQYGAGKVIIWDKGYWVPLNDADADYSKGNLKFELFGLKLHGKWVLVRIKNKNDSPQQAWLLIKEKDSLAKSNEEFSVVDSYPDSVNSYPFPPAPVSAKAGNDEGLTIETSIASISVILNKALKADLPGHLKPQLATLADKAPAEAHRWLAEVKFDGYRVLMRIDQGEIKLFTRNGNDWTHKLLFLQQEAAKLSWPAGWYDGEIVVNNAQGIPDFGALQTWFENDQASKPESIVFYVFDVVYFDGLDLRALPLINRRTVLQSLFTSKDVPCIRLSQYFTAPAQDLLKSACNLGLEGIILKRKDAPYVCSRTDNWLKLKCSHRQEFIIVGYTAPNGMRAHFGALILAVFDAGKLIHVGNVGTGFNQKSLAAIKQKLDAITILGNPLSHAIAAPSNITWVKPDLIAEVEFAEWTKSGHIRHGVFKGLRTDKQPETIVKEKPEALVSAEMKAEKTNLKPHKSLSVSHPERIIDAQSGITKLELVRYYELVGDLMMPHLQHRPVSFLRAPDGINGELFFQKHANNKSLSGVKKIEQANEKPALIEISKKQGIAYSAQWNVIEFHTHNGNLSLDKPDRMIFDLDPGEDVPWQKVQEAAQLMQAFLTQLDLPAFLKTSGGKGLHVVVPIQAIHDWDTVKTFSQAIVNHMSKTIPARFVAKSGPRNRIGKIFIDYLRNDEDATTVCAWSARARAGMGISVPVDWQELPALKSSDHWTVANAHTRLDKGNDAWQTYAASAVDLSRAMSLLPH